MNTEITKSGKEIKAIRKNISFLLLSFAVLIFGSDVAWLIMQIAILIFYIRNKTFLKEVQIAEHYVLDALIYMFHVFCVIMVVSTDLDMIENIEFSHLLIFYIVGIFFGGVLFLVRIHQKKRSILLMIEIPMMAMIVSCFANAADVRFDKSVPKERAAIITDKWTKGSAIDPDYYIKTSDRNNVSINFSCDKKTYMQFDLNESVIVEDHDGFFRIHWCDVVNKQKNK